MRRALGILVFLALLVGVLIAYHWLLIDRLLVQPGWSGPWVGWASGAIVAAGVAMPLSLISQRFFARPQLRVVLVIPAMTWMGASFLLFSGILATDLLHALTPEAVLGWLDATLPFALPAFAPARSLAVTTGAALLTLFGVYRALRPTARRVEVSLANWPSVLDGLRIVQLSDIHIGPILRAPHAAYLSARVNALKPDLVVLTGDLVDGDAEKIGDQIAPFAQIQAPLGRYFVTGNHDFYSGARPWCELVEGLGFEVLRNRHVTIRDQGASFALAGVDDHRGASMSGGGGGEDLHAALSSIDPSLCTILLAHDPATFGQASRMGIGLQLSGHTHGGQIWPFRYAVRLTTKWVAGLYREGPAQIYVSRGTGFWGPPIRVGAPAEITEITIRRA